MTLYAKFTCPDAGYYNDCKKVENFEVGQKFQVTEVSMGQSSTSIKLYGFSCYFNSVHFEFYKQVDDELVKHDIYSDPEYNPYIRGLLRR